MNLLGWLKRRGGTNGDRRLTDWQRSWSTAALTADGTQVAALRAALDGLGLPEEDVEIEREMLDALEHLVALAASVGAGPLPIVETGHRVVGAETCHFTAPASMPDDTAQPSGRLLLTGGRAIFVGGARGATVPWHSVGEVVHADRDLILIRADREQLYRFRFNSYSDALCGAFLAQRLMPARRRQAQDL